MNLLERVLTLVRFNLNTVVERSDDPEKVLRQLQIDMRNQLVQVKTQVATTIAERQKLQKRSKERQEEADVWLKKAELAVQQGHDDTARTALVRRQDALRQGQHYQQQQKEQQQVIASMRTALQQLETKISEVDTAIELLVTRKRTAQLQQRVYEALNQTREGREQTSTTKAQDAVLEAEARARALAALHQRQLDTQLEQLSADQEIEQRLGELKRKHHHTQDTSTRREGLTNTSPLEPLPSQPRKAAPKRAPKQAEPESTSPSTQDDAAMIRLQKMLETNQNP